MYIRDSGLVHSLLGIATPEALLNHPKVGASWEGFVVEQIAALTDPTPIYFWGTHNGAELDLLFTVDGRTIGIEIKRTSTPKVTQSMRNAQQDLGIDHIFVIYPGDDRFELAKGIEALPVSALTVKVESLLAR